MGNVMRASILWAAAVAASMAMPPAAAQGYGQRYEPSQRLRLLEGCMKDEVMHGAGCVKKCQADFRMDFSGKAPVCIAVKSDAKYTPRKAEYETPKTPPPAGAPGR
jgi:hypothetical protein